nr:hypothetical protein [Salinibacterium sp. NG253]
MAEHIADLPDPELVPAVTVAEEVDDLAHTALVFAQRIKPRNQ